MANSVLTPFQQLRDGISADLGSTPNGTLDMHRWISRTTVEYVSQGGLGTSLDVLDGADITHPYGEAMKRYMYVYTLLSVRLWSLIICDKARC